MAQCQYHQTKIIDYYPYQSTNQIHLDPFANLIYTVGYPYIYLTYGQMHGYIIFYTLDKSQIAASAI